MLIKRAQFKLSDIKLLNKPSLSDFIIDQNLLVNANDLRDTLVKLSAIEAEQKEAVTEHDSDNTYFDLEAEIESHPDSLYVKCFAIKADETNDNGDYFSREELKEATPTFVGVPVFTNHENNDVNKSRGKVVHSWWEDDKNGIMIIARVDSEAYPQLARGIKEEYIVGTSMGCQVKYSLCSICHNYAENPDQYCSHVKERKTRTLSAKNQKCHYHKNGTADCPLCGSTKKDIKTFAVNEQNVFEYNYGIKFIENSFVVNPACLDCGVTEVIDTQKFRAKVAAIEKVLPGLLKRAAEMPLSCTDQTCVKIAGQKEISDLNQALDMITSVSQAMLKQKDQIDLEFLSDLVKVLADLQAVTDELTEQGYGRLQSPSGEEGIGGDEGAPPAGQPGQQPPGAVPGTTAAPGPGKVTSGPAGAAGTVTSPMAKKKIDLKKLSQKLINASKSSLDLNMNLKIKKLNLDFKMKSNKAI